MEEILKTVIENLVDNKEEISIEQAEENGILVKETRKKKIRNITMLLKLICLLVEITDIHLELCHNMKCF